MSLLKVNKHIFWRGVNLTPMQFKLANLDVSLLLMVLVIVFAWIAQVIFWRMVGWEIALRMSLFLIAFPVISYFFASVVVASRRTMFGAYIDRILSSCWLGFGWLVLTSTFTALGILNQSILIFSLSAALLGAGLFPLMRQATLSLSQGQPKIVLIGATIAGVIVGAITTSGKLFVDLHLLQLTIAFVCCLTIAVAAMRVQTLLSGSGEKSAIFFAQKVPQQSLSDSLTQFGCGVLIAVPIALSPMLESLCGIALTGFGFGLIAHYGAILLPGFFVNKWRHTFFSYTYTGAYLLVLTVGHVLPLMYLARVEWW